MDLPAYVDLLGQEKFRSIIIHAPPEQASFLNKFAHRIPGYTGGMYFDVLKFFLDNPKLCKQVDRFAPDRLKDLLLETSSDQPVLVIDRLDFLLDTWRKREQQAFYRMISKQWNSFLPHMETTLIFCLQTSTEITSQKIADSHGKTRVHPLSSFNELA